jgi:LysM repeat protein
MLGNKTFGHFPALLKQIPRLIALLMLSIPVMLQANPDSVGVAQREGKTYVLHEVEAGETLYAISKRYVVSIESLYSSNKGLEADGLKLGQVLLVPVLQKLTETQMAAAEQASNSEERTPLYPELSPEHNADSQSGMEPKAYSSSSSDFIYHRLESGETLFYLSSRYRVSLLSIKEANPDFDLHDIPVGSLIRIPDASSLMASKTTPVQVEEAPQSGTASDNKPGKIKPFKVRSAQKSKTDSAEAEAFWDSLLQAPQAKYHEVKPGQTLFSIAQMYDGVNVEDLLDWNDLGNAVIGPGDQLIVGFDTHAGTWPELEPSGPQLIPFDRIDRGLATWLPEPADPDSKSLLALHNTAPLGSEIMVENLMNGRIIKARVIGRIPQNAQDQDALVKLSYSAAQQLGAHDPRVLVEVRSLEEAQSNAR